MERVVVSMLRSLSPSKSLGSKLVIFFLLGSVGPMILLTMINAYVSRANMLEVTRERIKAQADVAVERLEIYLEERQGDAQVVAYLPSVREIFAKNGSHDTDLATETLEQIRFSYGYAAISLIDTNGKIDASTDKDVVGQSRGNRRETQQALQGNTAISEVGTNTDDDTNLYFHVIAPVFGDDTQKDIIGAVDMRISAEKLDEIVGFDTGRSGVGSYSVLMDEYLVRISSPAYPDRLLIPVVPLASDVKQQMIDTQRFGSRTADVLDQATDLTEVKDSANQLLQGEPYVFFRGKTGSTGEMSEAIIEKLTTINWYYVHRVPEASFYGTVNMQTVYAFIVMVIVAVFALGIMIVFSRQALSRPLNSLVEVAKAIAGGDLNRRIAMRRQDEIGQLADTFNAMADSLQTRITTEQEAQQKAKQLQEQETQNRQELEQTVADYLAFVQRVAGGSLNQRINVRSNGSLGLLGEGLNGMVENLRTITRQVQEASTNTAAAAAEILAATTQQASSAAEQSSAITQATTTVEEVKNIAQQTAQQAGQVAKDSQTMLNAARKGTMAVEDTVGGMGKIRQRVESIAQTILALSEQTQAIGAITTTVSELADQSNLLALNAAIEAARAGEQGKSFAVVAQQVRELAERSKMATNQVQEILGEIQRATNAAVMVTEEGTKGVEEGVRLAGEAGSVIHQIAVEVESGSQSNTQIAAAAHQQTAGMEQIGQAMRSIQQATTQALASTRQAERAARDLNTLAQSLQQAISAYQL